MRTIALAVLALLPCVAQDDKKAQVDVAVRDDSFTVPPDLTLRARVTAMTPPEATSIRWRWGGEGLGGTPATGTLGENLPLGTWSSAVPVASFVKGKFPGKLFVTFVAGQGGRRVRDAASKFESAPRIEGQSTGVELEFELAWREKPVKTFKEAGPDGGTVGIVIPAQRLAGGKTPADPAFLEEFGGLLDYARRRAERLEALPEAKAPRPSKFAVVSDLSGYGMGHGYAIRHTNRALLEAELRSLKALGVNGLAGASRFLITPGSPFAHAVYAQLGGYPVPGARKGQEVPEAGCPFAPGVAKRTQELIEEGMAAARKMPVSEVWWRTEDEIGTVVDRAPEGKGHFAVCPACAEGFRASLKRQGLTPAELGKKDWDEVRPLDLSGKGSVVTADRAAGLLQYHSASFGNEASSKLFSPLRDAIAASNEEKRKNPAAPQPLVYSFALRGNTFLMGGHSLDFFEFYRHADNAMVYETSNRDARVWGWDSYLCDVGRVLTERQGIGFGVYVKPHRGAPIQRALAAASRGSRMIYWYTYGPDYVKGDTFAEDEEALASTARAAALLGRAEDLLYGSTWVAAPEVAVVNPRSSELWNKMTGASPAAYENAKWIYTALEHAHVPVDPLDEVWLATADLSRYQVIYVSGTHLTRAAAEKLDAWVRAGGTLYTSGGGCARDEANQPLAALGLPERGATELWVKVQAYGGGALELWYGAPGPEIAGPSGSFVPVVGREPLKPESGAEVVARFADGSPALTRQARGKGRIWLAAFYPGLEYSAGVRAEDFDLPRDFDAVRRSFIAGPALERVRPIVDAAQPLVEGLLVKNAAGKRAVTLMNWAYRVSGRKISSKGVGTIKSVVPFKELRVAIRGVGDVTRATSTALQQPLAVEKSADGIVVVLPILNEGDVLRLE